MALTGIETFGLLQAEEIMRELSDRDIMRAFATPAVAVNRKVVARLKRSVRFRDQSGRLRRGFSARQTPQTYTVVRRDPEGTRLSTVYSREPTINILEGGTVQRRYRGRNRGRVQARHIVQTALEQTTPEAVPVYTQYLNSPRGLQRVVERAAARKPRRDP